MIARGKSSARAENMNHKEPREIVQWVKDLPCKHSRASTRTRARRTPKNQCKKLGTAACTCIPALGSKSRQISGAHWPSSLANLINSMRDPVSKCKGREESHLTATSGLHTHTNTPAITRTYATHTSINIKHIFNSHWSQNTKLYMCIKIWM